MAKKQTYVLTYEHDGIPQGTVGTHKNGYFTFTNGSVKLTVKESHILKFANPKGA
jgi:hypothetical protein